MILAFPGCNSSQSPSFLIAHYAESLLPKSPPPCPLMHLVPSQKISKWSNLSVAFWAEGEDWLCTAYVRSKKMTMKVLLQVYQHLHIPRLLLADNHSLLCHHHLDSGSLCSRKHQIYSPRRQQKTTWTCLGGQQHCGGLDSLLQSRGGVGNQVPVGHEMPK